MQPRCDVTARVPSAALVPGNDHNKENPTSTEQSPSCLPFSLSYRLPCSQSSPCIPFPVPWLQNPTFSPAPTNSVPSFPSHFFFVMKVLKKRKTALLEVRPPLPGGLAWHGTPLWGAQGPGAQFVFSTQPCKATGWEKPFWAARPLLKSSIPACGTRPHGRPGHPGLVSEGCSAGAAGAAQSLSPCLLCPFPGWSQGSPALPVEQRRGKKPTCAR